MNTIKIIFLCAGILCNAIMSCDQYYHNESQQCTDTRKSCAHFACCIGSIVGALKLSLCLAHNKDAHDSACAACLYTWVPASENNCASTQETWFTLMNCGTTILCAEQACQLGCALAPCVTESCINNTKDRLLCRKPQPILQDPQYTSINNSTGPNYNTY